MPKTVEITPEVLAWAIEEEGLEPAALAERVGVSLLVFQTWLEGDSRPSKGQFSRLVELLHRPRALFLLPRPPKQSGVPPQLRSAPGLLNHDLSAVERRMIRRARRIQREASWLLREQGAQATTLPELRSSEPAEVAGQALRAWTGVTTSEQLSWNSPYQALREWRRVVDDQGVAILQLQLGSRGLRGFSLFDDRVPLVAVNTAYNAVGRVFTIFHELAHVSVRTDSACAGFFSPLASDRSLRLERWCEEVAASVLLPRTVLEQLVRERYGSGDLPIRDFDGVRRVAEKFNVSIRAAAVRLIRLNLAPGELYGLVEERAQVVDRPSGGGGGGGGRVTAQKRVDEYGRRLPGLFLEAAEEGALPIRDALDLVGITSSQMVELGRLVSSET